MKSIIKSSIEVKTTAEFAASPTPAAVRSPARPPAPVRSTPNAPSSRGRTSQGCMPPAQAVLPALK